MRIRIVNHLTRRPYYLIRACELEDSAETAARIASICNEPEVYDWLFREALAGKPYPEEKARQWTEWTRAGWTANSHFAFAVIDEARDIAAACDIKSSDEVAEIGYWAGRRHRGVMTNAVKAVCMAAAKAGFKGLFAHTKKGNTRSEAVLGRAGFARIPGARSDNRNRFELVLKGRQQRKAVAGRRPGPTRGVRRSPAGRGRAVRRRGASGR
jgi:RimJ/RimL family protein N-acetyltransferase